METPHRSLIRWGSKQQITFHLNSPIEEYPDLNEQSEKYDVQNDWEHPLHFPPYTPKDAAFANKSASVTFSTGDIAIHRTRDAGYETKMTPVPISFENKTTTMEAIEPPSRPSPDTYTDDSQMSEEVCNSIQDALLLGHMSSLSQCIKHRVREVTLTVTSANASNLRFDLEGLPKTIIVVGTQEIPMSLGSPSDIRKSLVERGVDTKRITDKWITNHSRWVNWKLAAYERRFSRFLACRHLTYQKLIGNIESRFRKELVAGRRPAIRKVLNRDVAASEMMILVVCQILQREELKGENARSSKCVTLELSDGWYSTKAVIDLKLSEFVESGTIKVGSKLLVSNATLTGGEDGVDPLDDAADKVFLKLSANSTRLGKWNAKLGFVRTSQGNAPNGQLLVKRISDIFPGGGNVPCIQLFVQRVYPVLYFEKCNVDTFESGESASTRRPVLTQQEEDNRRIQFEKRRSQAVEKVTERIQSEIENVSTVCSAVFWTFIFA
jgi:breast cancer 2 susceptibility protein